MAGRITDTDMMDFVEAGFREILKRADNPDARVWCSPHACLNTSSSRGFKTVRAAMRKAIRDARKLNGKGVL